MLTVMTIPKFKKLKTLILILQKKLGFFYVKEREKINEIKYEICILFLLIFPRYESFPEKLIKPKKKKNQ